jgi:hypothetical protein
VTLKVVVLHTTESSPGTCEAVAKYLVRMGYESHEVFDPSCGDLVQLLPPSEPGKSLVNLPGGVQTNRRGGVYQIEIVGRAVDVPGYDDAWYRCLYERLELVCAMTQTPLVFPLPFQPYPSSYGRNLVRMSFDEWDCFEGICGHQHVPENDHGDPGALDVARLQPPPPPEPEEDDEMPDYILRYAPDLNGQPWLAVYPTGRLRWIGGNEAGYLIAQGLPFVDEVTTSSYNQAKQDAGVGAPTTP